MPTFPPQRVRVRGAHGVVRLCEGVKDTFLLFEGMPSIIAWRTRADGHRHNILRAHDSRLLDPYLEQGGLHRTLVQDSTLVHQISPFLNLLTDGVYEVCHEPELQMLQEGPDGMGPQVDHFTEWVGLHRFHSPDGLLLSTRPSDLLDASRIAHNRERLREGARPPLIMLDAADDDITFLLSGHHLLQAYQLEKIAPPAVFITALQPEQLSAEDAAALIAKAHEHCGAVASAHYLAIRETLAPVT